LHKEARIANFVLASYAIISLTLLSLPLTGPVQAFKACSIYVLSPVGSYSAKATDRFANVPARVRDLLVADIENKRLLEETKKAEWTEAELVSLRAENERLRSALGLKAPAVRAPLWARVMQRDPLHWYRSIMIDAGALQGVSVNAPVLGRKEGGVVVIGRVVEVREKASTVLLVTDELSSVAAFVSTKGDVAQVEGSTETVRAEPKTSEGLLQGQGTARMRLNYLSPDTKAAIGDRVYTSPTSATFPADVLIGTVSNVFPPDPFLTFQSVEVQPALDASRLTEVMILKTLGSAQPVAPAKAEIPKEETHVQPSPGP
jgi:rod shape-determining protein MreC